MKKMMVMGIVGIVCLGVIIFLIISDATMLNPEKLVTKFYTSWTGGIYKIADKTYLKTNMLSDNLKNKIEAVTSENSRYNPIVCSQEKPNRFEIFPIKTTEHNVEIGVREYFDTIVKDIKVSLVKKNIVWKIDDIICGDEPKQMESAFEKEGNIVQKDGEWQLIYEEPGKPALSVILDFSNWRCGNNTDRCIPSFEQGDTSESYW